MRSVLIVIALALLLGHHGIAAPAGQTRIDLDHEIGFNGKFKLRNWTPLQVTLENRGPETRGRLEVIVTSGSEYRGDVYQTIYTTEVDLPRGTRKRYPFTVLIKSYTHDLLIRLRQNDKVLLSRSINLRSHFTEKDFVIVADNFLMPDTLSVMPEHLYPANIRPRSLPEKWYGYDSVKLLILRSDAIGGLRDRQFQALIRWLKQGGSLVLGSGLNYGSLTSLRIRRFLPIAVRGHRQLTEIASLKQFCGRGIAGIEPFLVLATRIDGSRILAKENDIPIVAKKSIGFGETIFLAFDLNSPPFSRWEGRRMFWGKILSLQREQIRPAIEMEDRRIVKAMLTEIPLGFAKFSTVVGFVGAYLVFLWIILKKIRRPGKSRWLYGMLGLVLIIIFSFIATLGLNKARTNAKFAYNSFCQLDVDDSNTPAIANFFIGLYSREKSAYGMKFGTHFYPVHHILPEKSATRTPAPYALHQTDSGQQLIGSISRWSQIMFKLKLHLASPLTGYARRDGSVLTLELDSELPHDLVDCLIYYNKKYSSAPNIRAGKRQIVKVDLVKLKKKEIFGGHHIDKLIRGYKGNGSNGYLRIAQQHLTPDFLLGIHEKYRSRPNSVVIIGWLDHGLIQPEFNRSRMPPGSGITVINWELPVEITL